jgi:mono/diheme cytochrome c family protein
MTSERAAVVFAGFLVMSGASCADFSRGPAPMGVDAGAASEGGTTDGAAGFAEVEAILTGNCQRCHSMGGEAGDTTFLLTGDPAADHATALNFVDVNTPGASRMLAKMSGNGHGGGTVFAAGTPEYETVLHWIQEGAPQ